MDKDKVAIPSSSIISCKDLARRIVQGNKDRQRFCFILGSGASVESGIPTGIQLGIAWMDFLKGLGKDKYDLQDTHSDYGDQADSILKFPEYEETVEYAKKLEKCGKLSHTLSEIIEAHDLAKSASKSKPTGFNFSEYYFDIYRLRFQEEATGYRYLERLIETSTPSIGYYTLTSLLTKSNSNNLLITTNFDSLVEDALFLFSGKKPLVINHESLAGFIDPNIERPIIAKIHRGLFYDPMNSPDLVLPTGWKNVLDTLLSNYTPIIIGYGGGDHSLMSFLEDKSNLNQMYWCFRGDIEEQPDRIKKMVSSRKNGRFVSIQGFDSLMVELGKAIFGCGALTESSINRIHNRRMLGFTNSWKLEERKDLERELAPIKEIEETEQLFAKIMHEPQRLNAATDLIKSTQDIEKAEANRDTSATNMSFLYFNRGLIRSNMSDYEGAIIDFSKAIELDGSNYDAYDNRGIALDDLQMYEEAIDNYQKAIALKPNAPFAYNNLGHTYNMQRRYIEAIEMLDKAIALKQNFVNAYINKAYSLQMLGETSLAQQAKAKAIGYARK